MTLDSIITIIKKIADISLVWLAIYYILKNIRNNVKLTLLFKGVAIILILKLVSNWLGLATIGLLLEYVIMWGPLALIIIFQPEIRNVLEQLGKTQLLGRHKVLTVDERERLVYEIVNAVEYLRKARIGALIVLERDISLANYIEKAKKVYAISIVVSEETGRVSIAVKGELFYNLSIDDVRMMLIDELRPKQEEDYLDELEEEDIYEEDR